LEHKLSEVSGHQEILRKQVEDKSAVLQGLGIEADAVRGYPHLEQVHRALLEKIGAQSAELKGIRQELALEEARLEALKLHRQHLSEGEPGPLRAHIHRAHHPSSDSDSSLASLAEFVAAISIGALMVGIVLLIIFARHYLLIGLAAMISLLIFIEAGFRHQLSRLINSLTVGLAIVSALILLFEFFWPIVVVAVLAAGAYIMWENLREIAS
jgi:hypothetical protein